MPTVQQISDTTDQILNIVDEIKVVIEPLVPLAAAPIELAEVFARLVQKALNGYSAAANIPITAETVLALLPDSTPLTPPTIQ